MVFGWAFFDVMARAILNLFSRKVQRGLLPPPMWVAVLDQAWAATVRMRIVSLFGGIYFVRR
jgi:hypothetical protein